MKPLRKSDRRRFEEVCSIIRKALHLDHLDRDYRFEGKDDGNIATTHVFSQGWRLLIYIRPDFWEHSYEKQLKFLIHEHVHVCLHPYHQAFDSVQDDWVPSHCRSQVQEKNHTSAEISVDHLESVFFELLKHKLL